MSEIGVIYLLAANVLSFLLYGLDKYKARKSQWRISETTLLMMAIVGGSVGAWAGMHVWRHKTRHLKFRYGVPAILFMQVAVAVYLVSERGFT